MPVPTLPKYGQRAGCRHGQPLKFARRSDTCILTLYSFVNVSTCNSTTGNCLTLWHLYSHLVSISIQLYQPLIICQTLLLVLAPFDDQCRGMCYEYELLPVDKIIRDSLFSYCTVDCPQSLFLFRSSGNLRAKPDWLISQPSWLG